jgi:hypothetical protein
MLRPIKDCLQSIGADKVQECSINYFTHGAAVEPLHPSMWVACKFSHRDPPDSDCALSAYYVITGKVVLEGCKPQEIFVLGRRA